MTEQKLMELSLRFLTDYPAYAASCLKIRSKTGKIEPFTFNRVQSYINRRLEDQKAQTGRVRALILKGRQQGCSTYVGGRFYHAATHRRGVKVFILTHEDEATKNLFEMVQRFNEHCPDEWRPETGASSAKELTFARLDSGYKVGTAGTKGVGRSATIQLFHGSEVAFWPHAETHASGILQAVPDEDGTEVILESTANGVGNFFHKRWRDAETGASEYQAIFIPWFWQAEYRKPVSEDFALDDEETEYASRYGLDAEQMAWRRNKIVELKDPILFKQEYPANAAEAFQLSGHDSYIAPALIAKARNNSVTEYGPVVVGFDPAWKGDARHSMAWRQGRRVTKVESKRGLDTMQAAGWAKQVLDKDKPARMFIDVGGVGAGVYDRLVEMGYGETVSPVNFGSKPLEPQPTDRDGRPMGGPLNRRAEMWMNSKAWLEEPAGVQIPDSDSLEADACGPSYKWDSLTRLQLESKEQMRARDVPSPDEWDAVALTFAEPVSAPIETETESYRPYRGEGGWMGI